MNHNEFVQALKAGKVSGAYLFEGVEENIKSVTLAALRKAVLAGGLAEEVSRLLKSGVPRDAKALKAIGYKEMIPYALGETTLDEAVYALKLNTRHYAKRQLTWMRREEDVLWVDALEPDAYDKLEAYYTQGEAK
mgnify:CR=1 FL=1